jgi:1-aminocyclopropane-1-carboxylate deaminase
MLDKKDILQLLTFGGAYSNHILATAAAGNLLGFETVGVIRGEELALDIEGALGQNPTLNQASNYGIKFEFVSRAAYRNKMDPTIISSLKCRYGDFYLLPEGGTNTLAVQGCEEILTKQDVQFDYICSCVGTGGTLAGLINSIQEPQKILGFPALKGDFLQDEIQQLVGDKDHWELITDYHFGGYAKYSDKLIEFLNEFREQTSIPLDPIYTGKMMFGVLDMIAKNRFPIGSKILVIHTGGLQGISGFNQRLKNKGSKLRIGQ